MNGNVRYPIGVKPKYVFQVEINNLVNVNGGTSVKYLESIKRHRLEELKGAIKRYTENNLHIDMNWLIEYNSILTELGVKENNFKL